MKRRMSIVYTFAMFSNGRLSNVSRQKRDDTTRKKFTDDESDKNECLNDWSHFLSVYGLLVDWSTLDLHKKRGDGQSGGAEKMEDKCLVERAKRWTLVYGQPKKLPSSLRLLRKFTKLRRRKTTKKSDSDYYSLFSITFLSGSLFFNNYKQF